MAEEEAAVSNKNNPATTSDQDEGSCLATSNMNDDAASSQDDDADNLYEKKWNTMFARLKAFKEKHGHCRVPNRYTEDPQLGNWVSTQRRQHRILATGANRSVPLTPERASQLNELGFEWSAKDPTHKSWGDRFEELCAFKQKYGNTLVPMGWKENPRLATWVSTQRQEYKQLQNGHSSRLNATKVDKLNSISFVWEAQRGRRKLPNPLDPVNRTESVKQEAPSDTMSSNNNRVGGNADVSGDQRGHLLALLQQQLLQQQASASQPAAAVTERTATAPLAAAAPSQRELVDFLLNQARAQQASEHPNEADTTPNVAGTVKESFDSQQIDCAKDNPLLSGVLAGVSMPSSDRSTDRQDLSLLVRALGLQSLVNRPTREPSLNRESSNALQEFLAKASLAPAASATAADPSTNERVPWENEPQHEQVLKLLVERAKQQQASSNTGTGQSQKLSIEQSLPLLQRRQAQVPGGASLGSSSITPQDLQTLLKEMQTQAALKNESERVRVPGLATRHDSIGGLETADASVTTASQRGAGGGGSGSDAETKALALISLYAQSLPAGCLARSALQGAVTLSEAQNILKQDIIRYFATKNLTTRHQGATNSSSQEAAPRRVEPQPNDAWQLLSQQFMQRSQGGPPSFPHSQHAASASSMAQHFVAEQQAPSNSQHTSVAQLRNDSSSMEALLVQLQAAGRLTPSSSTSPAGMLQLLNSLKRDCSNVAADDRKPAAKRNRTDDY